MTQSTPPAWIVFFRGSIAITRQLFVTSVRLILAVLVLVLPFQIAAQVPGKIAYQGYLTSSTGAPVNGQLQMSFKLYSVATGGAPLWSESQNVNVSNGLYTLLLGSAVPFNVSFNVQYYLGVSAGADPEMIPRPPLASAPYALRAAVADSVQGQTPTTSVTRSNTDATGVGSVSCLAGEILVGGGCYCTGSRSSGTNYGVSFGCFPTGQSYLGGCYDHLYSSFYGPSPIETKAICLSGNTIKSGAAIVNAATAGDSAIVGQDEVEQRLSLLRQRREEISRLAPR